MAIRTLVSKLRDSQVALCNAFDSLLPAKFRVDGYEDFFSSFAVRHLKHGQVIYDVGGGSHPFVEPPMKSDLGLKVIGLDIDIGALQAAPPDSYDGMVCADITRFHGDADADVVICGLLLEHVKETPAAMAAIQSMLKPGGVAVLFVPCRNALYARINRILPHGIKKRILYFVFPYASYYGSLPAYYHRCTPRDFHQMARENGFAILEYKPYFLSTYFTFLFPLHALWRLWSLAAHWVSGDQAAETFALALRKGR